MERLHMPERRAARFGLLFAAVLLLALFAAGSALAERHTVMLDCGGGGLVGKDDLDRIASVRLEPEEPVKAQDGTLWTIEELRQLPDFRLEGVALRFSVSFVGGESMKYALSCGAVRSKPQQVHAGRNLWDVTEPVSVWLEKPEEPLYVLPVLAQYPWGIRTDKDSFRLQLTFSTSGKLPDFPMDKVRYGDLYETSLSMLEEGNPFVSYYDDTADSLMEVSLPLGVPYYYAGGTEDKFLHRFYPSTTTRYYLDSHMYLCGLDCVGMTHLIYEKCGLERHPSISDILHYGIGSDILKNNDPSRWPMFLKPGDLIGVKHGTFHIMMYLGTMRQFGITESTAGEAAELLDYPLVIHCGGNPFYYDRYEEYIREQGFRNTYPPDGGVTVSVIRETDKDAPHSRDTSWGKHFGWYQLQGGEPLLVFRLDDCTDMAWYGPER